VEENVEVAQKLSGKARSRDLTYTFVMLKRLRSWLWANRRPPTMEELAARKDARKILDERDTSRVREHFGPEGSSSFTQPPGH
jgi:hypothetical protein